MAPKVSEVLSIQEAMDNLSVISSIDMNLPPPIGIMKKKRFAIDEEELGSGRVEWVSGEGGEVILELLDATYRTVHHHLIGLYGKAEMDWQNERSRKGIASLMAMVGESASKMDEYLAYRLGSPLAVKIEEREDFKALQRFYVDRFQKKFDGGIEGAEAWREEWNESGEGAILDVLGSGLKDFETVQKDLEYELFYIRNEEGRPYFTPELIRNIRLSANFDLPGESFEEDPFLQVRSMLDRDLHASAMQILEDCRASIADFYKFIRKLSENQLAEALSLSVIALMMAANPRHLLQNTSGKSSYSYFDDFHRFLRRAMKTPEYQKMIAYPPEKNDKISHCLLHLTHHFCFALFHRQGGTKQEAIGLIHRTMRKGEEIAPSKVAKNQETFWNQMLLEDETIRGWLGKFPSGPLFKILDLIREETEEDIIVPFDPMGQDNLPMHLFYVTRKGKNISILKIPSPTRQSVINKVEAVEEFRGFLRGLSFGEKKRRHLLINLQDRTSWRESARSRMLENMQKSAEFNGYLFVLTLPKDTDFYHQNNEYLNMNQAKDFIETFQSQLETPEECGFCFPHIWKLSEVQRFAETSFAKIHQQYFEGKATLTRRNREDFIEIFYQSLIFKAMEDLGVESMSFTCKDAVDTGAIAAGMFFAFHKLSEDGLDKKETQDFLRWLFYTPALFLRERAVDALRLHRAISALAVYATHEK